LPDGSPAKNPFFPRTKLPDPERRTVASVVGGDTIIVLRGNENEEIQLAESIPQNWLKGKRRIMSLLS
jgi:hypothetical protein